jgi:hypothetical protein
MSTLSKGGTGAGAVLVINATPATIAAPVAAPSIPPTALTLAPAATPTGIALLQIKDFTLPEQKLSFDDITNTGSPSDIAGTVTKESIPTVLDPGEFTATGVFLPGDPGLIALQTAFLSGLANQYQVQLQKIAGQVTSGNVYDFNGWVSSMPTPVGIGADKTLTVKINIKLQGIMTIKTGS